MKELEKTKRISVAAVISILIVIIALLSYKRPKHLYSVNTHDTLEKITNTNYLIAQNDIDDTNSVLIDIRNQFEFDKGHIENAINMSAPEILNEENSDILKNLKEENKILVLYGNNPNEAIAPFMLLSQLGFDSIKILSVENSYFQNKLITKDVTAESSAPDINSFIQESIKRSQEAMDKAKVAPKPKITTIPKKIIPVVKKKKMPVEGGC